MKIPVKVYRDKPAKRESKLWYPCFKYDTNEIVFIEWSEKQNLDDDYSFIGSLNIKHIQDCIDQIVEKYKISPLNISIKAIELDDDGDCALEFAFTVYKSDEQYKKEMQDYLDKEQEYQNQLTAYNNWNKQNKIAQLKNELDKLINEH